MTNTRHAVAVAFCLALGLSCANGLGAGPLFNVRDFGAAGDGKTLDTAALNKAIDACSSAGGGQVLVPPGNYLCGTVRLKSNITVKLDDGAQIIGTPDLDQYQGFAPPGQTPLASRLRWHRALMLGDGVENVTIAGGGTINGNKVFDARGEEHMRGPTPCCSATAATSPCATSASAMPRTMRSCSSSPVTWKCGA